MFVERLAAAPVTCLTGDQSGEWLEEQLDLKPEIGLEAAEKNPKWIWNEPEKDLKMFWECSENGLKRIQKGKNNTDRSEEFSRS